MIVASFSAFLLLFMGVGLASAFRAKNSRGDYYLASREVSPWLVGLSAVATNNSGYMFIGVIGFTYTTGLAAIWLMIGWVLGDYIASTFVHKRLREAAGRTKEASFPAVIAAWHGNTFTLWPRIAAVMMVIFLGAYSAAQISAGGKALQGVLHWDPRVGAVVVAAMILAYSVAGGIRASIWTDAVQSIVMLFAMMLLFAVGLHGQGGVTGAITAMSEIPGYLNWFPDDLLLPGLAGMGLFILGWMFAGLSVIGQPHIMIRFMALDKTSNMGKARAWYYFYFSLFYALATGVGLLSRLYLPDLGAIDPELALPTMAADLLPGIAVGAILAGIFAATMSTADSLILSCSAAITHDLVPARMEKPWQMKAATAAVTGFALLIALGENQSVFTLVILAWSVLASAFAPILILYALGRKLPENIAILSMLAGVSVALGWRYMGWHGDVYEGLPGILAGIAIALPFAQRVNVSATLSEKTA